MFKKEGGMNSKSFVTIGCLLLLVALILKGMGFVNPEMVIKVGIKPSSFIILANTSFILAVLLKK